MRRIVVTAAVLWLVNVSAGATQQTALPRAPTFEVVSIKPASKEAALAPASIAPDRFYRRNVTLLDLVNYAFDIRPFRIFGGDRWISSEQWDVSAKADRPLTRAESEVLVQRLLAARFALRVRKETRELPIYHLVFARADKRLGPQMKPAAFDCEPYRRGERPIQDSPIDTDGFRRCGIRFQMGGGITTARFDGTPTARLAVLLQTNVNRMIIDRTGLDAAFDVQLTYEDERYLLPGATRREGGVSLFTALEEQLGLKLESARGPVEVLVIESAERPTPD